MLSFSYYLKLEALFFVPNNMISFLFDLFWLLC